MQDAWRNRYLKGTRCKRTQRPAPAEVENGRTTNLLRPPLFDAIDTNHDGAISVDEMNNAPTAVKTLLKNGATQLTREDLRSPRPPQQ